MRVMKTQHANSVQKYIIIPKNEYTFPFFL